MTSLRHTGRRHSASAAAPRVGLFGQGNLGNDGSLEAALADLRAESNAILDVLCSAPNRVTARFGTGGPAALVPPRAPYGARHAALAMKGLGTGAGMGIDACRIAAWVRRHDVVIVPGMGVLEATLPLRLWQTPYLTLLLCASGRLFGTKVALVSVRANVIQERVTRLLVTSAARVHCRSFRDTFARDAVQRIGVDTSGDRVYPDLVFSLPVPPSEQCAEGSVGLMEYTGGNDDRRRAAEIRATYIKKMTSFILWLIDNGPPVRLLAGYTIDHRVVEHILADLPTRRPGFRPSSVIAEPASSLSELMRQMASVDTVVATAHHTVLCALKLAKPTQWVGYGGKFGALMADMGTGKLSQSAKSLDMDHLIGQLSEIERLSAQLRRTAAERTAANERIADLSSPNCRRCFSAALTGHIPQAR